MRRKVLALCMVMMIFCLTACTGNNTGNNAGSNTGKSPAPEQKVEKEEKTKIKAAVKPVGSYVKLNRYLKKITKEQTPTLLDRLTELGTADKDVAAEIIEDSVSNTVSSSKSNPEPGDYGKTNVTTEGVDEADVMKNDGNYLYIMDRGDRRYVCDYIYDDYVLEDAAVEKESKTDKQGIHIIRVEKDKMEQVGFLPIEDNCNSEFYLAGDQIILVTEDYMKEQTVVHFYDIKDRTAPKLVKSVTQDGGMYQSRVQGDYVYLATLKYNDYIEHISNEECIPRVDGNKVSIDCIYIPSESHTKNFLTCTSISLKEHKLVDSVAFTNTGDHFYMSNKSIYISSCNYKKKVEGTEFIKVQVEDGEFTVRAKKTLEGYLTDDFAINEYNDHLRLVMQKWDQDETTTMLYVLDDDMKLVGTINDLAPDEQIHSARFMGDVGYFVTFRQIDPLFSVDLSEPKNPKIIGELKIPGFSEYLHPYSEDLLLGIGYSVEENHTDCIKLSMFDISDPSNVIEQDVKPMDGHDYASCMYSYKDLCINGEKNIFGFSAQRRYMDGDYTTKYDYILASYDKEKGFRLKTVYTEEGYGDNVMRGTYVGDTFYTISVNDHKLIAIDLNTMEEIGSYEFE